MRLQNFLKEADAKAEKLSSEIFELRRRIGSLSAEPEKLPSLSKTRQGTPGRSAIPRKDKNQRKDPSVVETLQGYGNHLDSMLNFEGKIAKFEEVLMKLKSDLYGSFGYCGKSWSSCS